MFDSISAIDVNVVSPTEIDVLAPAHPAGTVHIGITTPAGTATLAAAYTYLAPPQIRAISPAKGAAAGGTTVTVSGAHFERDATRITFGGASAIVVNATDAELTVMTPAGTSGLADVVVETPGGSATLVNGFQFVAQPTVSSFAPMQGAVGTRVTLVGDNFDTDTTGNFVTLGGVNVPVEAANLTHLTVVVPAGARTGLWSVTTIGGTDQSRETFVIPSYLRLTVTPEAASLEVGSSLSLTVSAFLTDGTTEDVSGRANWSSNDAAVAAVDANGRTTANAAGQATVTAMFAGMTASATITVPDPLPLPPDPSLIAPLLDRTVPTSVFDSTAFLYTGVTPVQKGVLPGTIQPDRVALLRGRVLQRDGSPLRGATITIATHPEYGSTLSRADGMFDLVINGGGVITIHYEKESYIGADRTVMVQWQEQKVLDDVVLIAYDLTATRVVMGAPAYAIAQGSITIDGRGSRRATIIVPSATTASLQYEDGHSINPPYLTIRAMEYTVGAFGPAAMPATLPAQSGYTYCVELSADEATSSRATGIAFSQAVALYVENFLDLPTGIVVPSGYYDRGRREWIAAPNGVVLKILSVIAGFATLDTNGDSIADTATTLASLGITDAEREQLALLYSAGQTLWRAPLTHFTPADLNYPFGPPVGAQRPPRKRPSVKRSVNAGRRVCGWSTIDCENMTLIEQVPIVGTPYSLSYDSGRVSRARYKLTVDVSDATINPDVKAMELRVQIAGRKFVWSYQPGPNVRQEFEWDGRDAYGRYTQGAVVASVEVIHYYPWTLYKTLRLNAFALPADTSEVAKVLPDNTYPVNSTWEVTLGSMDVAPTGFGGWAFSAQSQFDPRGQAIYLPSGRVTIRDPRETGEYVINRIAGNGRCCISGSGPARDAQLDFPTGIAAGPDGSFYLAENRRLRRVGRDGTIEVIAGTAVAGYSGDGGPATAAQVRGWDIAVGPDGAVFFSDGGTRVRRIARDGIVTTVAGNGILANNGDGGLATAAAVRVEALTTSIDGSVYVASTTCVRRITPDGRISTIAGGGSSAAEGILATTAAMGNVVGVAVGVDGSVYVTEGGIAGRIRRITPDGIVRTIAGSRVNTQGYVKDGALATAGALDHPYGITVGADGTVFVAEYGANRIRAIGQDGIIRTVAGNGNGGFNVVADGWLARGTPVSASYDVDIAPDGSVLVVDETDTARRITAPFPTFGRDPLAEAAIAAPDGLSAFIYRAGRHVRTTHRLSGAVLEQFTYDAEGRVIAIADADNNVTSIERQGDGKAIAIVAPNGLRTALAYDADGRLSRVESPSGAVTMTYSDGVLETFHDIRGGLHRFTFNDEHELVRDEDPAGGYVSFTPTVTDNSAVIVRTSPEGRQHAYSIVHASTYDTSRSLTTPDGFSWTAMRTGDGTDTYVAADGTKKTTVEGADPIFGLAAPLAATITLRLPSGLQRTESRARTTTLSDPANPFSVLQQVDTLTINGKTWRSTYHAPSRSFTLRTPAGRLSQLTLDSKGRMATISSAGRAATEFSYDGHGRLAAIKTGTRQTTLSYDSSANLSSVSDSVGRTISFGYDDVGRRTSQALGGNFEVRFARDSAGNITAVQPPGRDSHQFELSSVDRIATYAPPLSPPITYERNSDRQITTITRASGDELSLRYDAAGRETALLMDAGAFAYSYSGTTGHLSSITSPDNVGTTYSYDGPLVTSTSWTGAVQGSVTRSFNTNFQLASENGFAYGYDPDGLPILAGALVLTRDAQSGALTGTKLGVVAEAFAYNTYGELSDQIVSAGTQAVIGFHYIRDDAGRITRVTETVASGVAHTTEYEYDAVGRLTGVVKDATRVAAYFYDDNGNRLERRFVGGTEAGLYDSEDRLLEYDGTTYEYTPDGELQSMATGASVTSLGYDALGLLHSVTDANGRQIRYLTDGEQRRVAKTVDGRVSVGWLYGDGLRIVAELDGTGAVISRFVYGTRANSPDYMIKQGVEYRLICDHIGSPRLVVRASDGLTMQELEYDAFGRILRDTNPGYQPFGFAGGLYDHDTGLVHFGVRDYDPRTGRWITRERVPFQGLDANLYAYSFSDPVNLHDANGRWTGIDEIGGAVIGGLVSSGTYMVGQLIKYHGNLDCIDGRDLGVAFGVGFVAGFFATDTLGASVAVAVGANTAQYAGIQALHGREITGMGLVANGLAGAISGVASHLVDGAAASTIENISRGPSRVNYPTSAIDGAIDNAPRNIAAGYIGNADPDCGCK